MQKNRSIMTWVLHSLLFFVFMMSGVMKLLRSDEVVQQFTDWGLIDFMTPIAILEIACALLFLIPKTNSLGVLLLTAFLGGAVVTHLSAGQSMVPPVVTMILVWAAAYLRHPTLLASFQAPDVEASQPTATAAS